VIGRWSGSVEAGLLAFDPVDPPDLPAASPAAFLDRDGVLNETVPDPVTGVPESPLDVAEVRLLPEVAEALAKLAAAGYALVCVSNQPAAAKGKVTVERLQAVHERVLELLALKDVRISASRLCLHHRDGVVPGLSGSCDCRKPAPGMLLDAAASLSLNVTASWMLGDTDTDVTAGQAAGCRTVLIGYPGSAHKRAGGTRPDLRALDLADGVAQLLDHGGG